MSNTYAHVRRRPWRLLAVLAVALMALTVVARGHATINNGGPLPAAVNIYNNQEKYSTAGEAGALFDWANSGACTYNTSPITCAGSNGIFNGGTFNGATTPPTPPNYIAGSAFTAHVFDADPLSGDVTACGTGDPSTYTGGNVSKNGSLISSMQWTKGSVQNKDELLNVFAVQAGSAAQWNGGAGRFELYFGAERDINNGDSHIDYEFTQNQIKTLNSSGVAVTPGATSTSCSGTFSGHRQQGDLFIAVDFTTGGAFGGTTLYEWLCTPPANLNGGPFQPSGAICDPTAGPHVQSKLGTDPGAPAYYIVSEGTHVHFGVNASGPVNCGGWACRNANGTQSGALTGPPACTGSCIDTNEFMEGGVDLGALGFTGCLATLIPHTRSSQSPAATLADFAGPNNFGNCSTSVTTTITDPSSLPFSCPASPGTSSGDTVNVGTTVTDTACVYGQGGTLGGSVDFKVYNESTCTTLATVPAQVSANDSGAVNLSGGSASFSFTANLASPPTYYVQATFSGSGVNAGSVSGCTDEPLVVNPLHPTIDTTLTGLSAGGQDAGISVAIGTSVTDQATLSGTTATAGGTVTYTVYPTLADCTATPTPTNGTSEGVQTVTNGSAGPSNSFTASKSGTYFWQAVYSGDHNNVGVSSGCSEEVLTVIDAGINLTPLSAVNIVGNPHTFTATLQTTSNDGSTFTNAPDGITITFALTQGSPSPNASFVGGASSCLTGTPTSGSGACSVSVTGTAAGTVTINACATFTLTGVQGSFTRCTDDTGKFDGPHAQKTFVQPATQLKVTDTLTGLPNGAVGTVSYTFYNNAIDCANGTNPQANGGGNVTSATATSVPVVPDSNTQTIINGTEFYTATFTGTGGTTPSGSFTSNCTKETATVTS
jgi:hypothetical protein